MLGRFYFPDGIDLVNLGDIRAFMLVNDNLYNLCVHAGARQYPLAKHYADVCDAGYQPSPAEAFRLLRADFFGGLRLFAPLDPKLGKGL
jgi:hypothetical protein